jgi:hypothetical protein
MLSTSIKNKLEIFAPFLHKHEQPYSHYPLTNLYIDLFLRARNAKSKTIFTSGAEGYLFWFVIFITRT